MAIDTVGALPDENGKQRLIVLEHAGKIDPEDIEAYMAVGGYATCSDVLQSMTPAEVIEQICNSGLRGAAAQDIPSGLSGQRSLKRTAVRSTSSVMATRATPARLWIAASWKPIRTVCWKG